MEEELEMLREKLNLLVFEGDAVLHSAEILRLSQELDKLIYNYYKKTNSKHKLPVLDMTSEDASGNNYIKKRLK